MITEEELTKIISDDIAKNQQHTNWSKDSILKCLTLPTLKSFTWPNETGTSNLWLVFHENPEDQKSYKIIYSDEDRAFGIATNDIVMGIYGTFIETLKSL